MKHWLFRAMWLSLPLLAHAESTAQRDFTRVLALKPDADHGREIFEACAECHKADGNGTPDGSIPRIAGQHYRVLARQLVDFRHGARWDMRMEGIATSHEVIPELQDIADVASFVSTLSRDGLRGVGDGQNVARGEAIYSRACASCHGAQGQGDEARGIPRIAGQHAAYVARQIYDAVDGRRPALSRTHRKRFVPLEFEEVLGLSDYVSRMGWSPAGQ